jgi:hypothetical protein
VITKLFSLSKKTPTTALLSFLKQSFTTCKLLGFKNFESLVFGAFLSKTENFVVSLLAQFIFCAQAAQAFTFFDYEIKITRRSRFTLRSNSSAKKKQTKNAVAQINS